MKNLSDKQRIIESLFKSGRVHVAGGESLFEYPGAIFSAADFLAENTARLEAKLRNAVELQIKIEEFDKANPNYEYTKKQPHIDKVVTYETPLLKDKSLIAEKTEHLRKEILEKVSTLRAPLPHAQATKLYLSQQLLQMPPDELKWLQQSGTELVYSNDKSYNPEGKVVEGNYASLYPSHPSCDFLKTGGGSLISWGGPFTYSYTSAQRDPKILIAHELLGHGLHSEAIKLYGDDVNKTAYESIARDLGDLNKRHDTNPQFKYGRVGQILELANSSETPLEFYQKAKEFDPQNTPAFRTDEGRKQWASGMENLAREADKKMGETGWMYKADCYNDPEQMMKELVAAYAELKYVEGKEHPDQLAFLLPEMTKFWEKYPARAMQEQLAEAKAAEEKAEAEKQTATPQTKPQFFAESASHANASFADEIKKPSTLFFIASAVTLVAIPLIGWTIPLILAGVSLGLGITQKMEENRQASSAQHQNATPPEFSVARSQNLSPQIASPAMINYRNNHAEQYLASRHVTSAERAI